MPRRALQHPAAARGLLATSFLTPPRRVQVHGARALQARTEDGAGRELNQYVIIIPAVATAISRATDNCATGSNQIQCVHA